MKLRQQQITKIESILNSIEEKIEQMELDLCTTLCYTCARDRCI